MRSVRRFALLAVLALTAGTALAVQPQAGPAAFPRSADACPDLAVARIAEEPLLAPAPANHPPLPDACGALIRPGASLGGFCTLNFVFTDAAGSYYIGTAGHCIGVGQRASIPGIGQFGTTVFSRRDTQSTDFALIKVDAAKNSLVRPTLCTWGGPIGGADPGSSLPRDILYEYGWGTATTFHQTTRARVHVLQSESPTYVTWIGEGSGGDSGAPIVNQAGYAVAIHTYGLTPFVGVVGEGGASFARILSLGRTVVPTLELATGDPSSLETAMLDLTY